MGKRGQVTIYVIIAIVVVALIVLIFMFKPEVESFFGSNLDPNAFLNDRLKTPLTEEKEFLSKQGGYIEPEGFILYKGNKIKYLCYNYKYYLPCKVQQPMIKQKFEEELAKSMESDVKNSIIELKSQLERRGYEISGGNNIKISTEMAPNKVKLIIDSELKTKKGEETKTYEKFEIELNSEMYFLLMTATSIVDFESAYGDSETRLYLLYYPNLVIEKNKLGDGSKIYKLKEITTNEEFYFASRSVAWPGGLGLTA